MVFGGETSLDDSLVGNELRKIPPACGLGGGGGDLGAFPAWGSSSGGSSGRDDRVATACSAGTWGSCSQVANMEDSTSVSVLSWEAKSPSRFSCAVSLPYMSHSGPSLPWG